MDGACTNASPERALTVIPRGYPAPHHGDVLEGEHPLPGTGSFAAGRRALDFAAGARRPILLLLSGGGSACAEVPASSITREDLLLVWEDLLRSGLPITAVNLVRARLSAIKGGGLGRLMQSGSIVLIHSDVPPGRERAVASSPAFSFVEDDEELERAIRTLSSRSATLVRSTTRPDTVVDHPWHVTGSSDLLVREVARQLDTRGWDVRVVEGRDALDHDADDLAEQFIQRAAAIGERTVLAGGGEARVAVHGTGRGGRCTDLGARLTLRALRAGIPLRGLLLATDGVDGSSGLAGIEIDSSVWRDVPDLERRIERALERSDSASVADYIGRPVIMAAGGNNLRDLLLLARG